MSAGQLGALLASCTALVVAVGHLVADITGLLDGVRTKAKARRNRAAAGEGKPPAAAS